MAFRDDRAGLRHRIGVLEEEIEAAEAERDELRAEAEGLDREITEEARKRRKGKGALAGLMVGIAVLGVAVSFFVSAAGGSDSEMLYGRAHDTTGSAPAEVGDPCTVFVTTSSGNYSHQFAVLCGSTVVYGGGDLGFVDCETDGAGRAAECSDEDDTPEGGDPQLYFNRANRTIVVLEGSAWSVEVELTTPPEGARGI